LSRLLCFWSCYQLQRCSLHTVLFAFSPPTTLLSFTLSLRRRSPRWLRSYPRGRLSTCMDLMAVLCAHPLVGPFLEPVNASEVIGYAKVRRNGRRHGEHVLSTLSSSFPLSSSASSLFSSFHLPPSESFEFPLMLRASYLVLAPPCPPVPSILPSPPWRS